MYAIYASGKDAVFGGMLTMGVGWLVWAFIAHRFTVSTTTARVPLLDARIPAAVALCIVAVLGGSSLVAHATAPAQAPAAKAAPKTTAASTAPAPAAAVAGALNRIRTSGQIRLGYRADARPFAYTDEAGKPAGYSIAVCEAVVDALKSEPGFAAVTIQWVPVTMDDRFAAIEQGRVDLLCGADTVTLGRRAQVSFSVPIFPGGVGALMRADAPARLREVLSGRGQTFRPTWRAAASNVIQARTFSAVEGTTADTWLAGRIRDLNVITEPSRVSSYDAGVQGVVNRTSDAFFGERAVLLDIVKRRPSHDLIVLDRLFTYEPLALAFARGDDEFRLLVDRSLSRFYVSGKAGAVFTQWFAEPDQDTLTFFRWNALPE